MAREHHMPVPFDEAVQIGIASAQNIPAGQHREAFTKGIRKLVGAIARNDVVFVRMELAMLVGILTVWGHGLDLGTSESRKAAWEGIGE